MKSIIVACVLVLCLGLVCAEISTSNEHNNPIPILEKDVEDAKERWIPNMDENDEDEDIMQHPIDEGPRRTDREMGDVCTYSKDCSSGCCLLDRKTKLRSCQPKALLGEKCSNAQVKADTYVDACPCVSGYDFCSFPKEVCTK